jgi:SAM-dependent methyltransferase
VFSFVDKLLRRQRPLQTLELTPIAGVTATADAPRRNVIDDDDEMAWFWPPTTIADVASWDKYWRDQVTHGLTPPLFDMLNNSADLAAVMSQHGLKTLLCAGNGISQEPRAFAEAGFHATALDSSPFAAHVAQTWEFASKDVEVNMGSRPRCDGGVVQFVVGDILDRSVCPGPFDVVIERRMLQLFEKDQLAGALDALASRLKEDGILLSHCHNGAWRPGQDRIHPMKVLLEEHGWRFWTPYEGSPKPLGRVAWLFFSTG